MYTERQMHAVAASRVMMLEMDKKELQNKVEQLSRANLELELENQQLRDSIVEMVRRMQEVVTWNELDAPRRREDDDE